MKCHALSVETLSTADNYRKIFDFKKTCNKYSSHLKYHRWSSLHDTPGITSLAVSGLKYNNVSSGIITASLALAVRRYYTGCKILKRVTWHWPRPFLGRFFIARVGLAMISQCAKFEVSRFTVTTLWMAVQNAENGVVWGWLGGTQGHRQCHHSIERIRLPIQL